MKLFLYAGILLFASNSLASERKVCISIASSSLSWDPYYAKSWTGSMDTSKQGSLVAFYKLGKQVATLIGNGGKSDLNKIPGTKNHYLEMTDQGVNTWYYSPAGKSENLPKIDQIIVNKSYKLVSPATFTSVYSCHEHLLKFTDSQIQKGIK